MADMSFDGIDDLTQYFEKIGGDVEKVEPVALKAGGEIIAERQRSHVNRSDKNNLICRTTSQSPMSENPRTE
ncbi:hypothetical protein [Bacillus velezensis]|uniref:hypothetical protein n=1 Tax=Bacillus velezensis TaxID=492670 RepID=UPI001E45E0C4|nr:hypothetical protein [Bacillus velezensis]